MDSSNNSIGKFLCNITHHDQVKVLQLECGACDYSADMTFNESVQEAYKKLYDEGWRYTIIENMEGIMCPDCIKTQNNE